MHFAIIEEWKNIIIENAVMVDPIVMIKVIEGDPEDNKFVEAAVSGEADFIVSQDKHLLKLKEYGRIRILKPEEVVLIL